MNAPMPPNGQQVPPQPIYGQPMYPQPPQPQPIYGQQYPYPHPQQVPPQQRVARPPSKYGWGVWALVIGGMMLFAGLAAATGTADSCNASTQSYSEWSACVDKAGAGNDTAPDDGAVALIAIGWLGTQLIGVGAARMLCAGSLVDALGKAVRGLNGTRKGGHTGAEFAPMAEPVYDYYEPQPQSYVQEPEYTEQAPEPQAAPAPDPASQAPRSREGWGARRGLDFGGDES